MNLTKMMEGKRVELPAMLDARERRAFLQMQLVQKYGKALISFTLNIAGPVKVFPLSVRTFEEGLRLIRICCGEYGIPILHEEILREYTGYEAFLAADADPAYVKRVLTSLEDDHSLGRLFDIDIIRPDLSKVSRKELGKEERRCLICGGPAFVCSGRRLHSVEELQERTVQIMWDYFAFRFADDTAMTACRALLYEVMATPKPGLVDRDNTGAHDDMDIFTFETSALALLPYFRRFVSWLALRKGSSPGGGEDPGYLQRDRKPCHEGTDGSEGKPGRRKKAHTRGRTLSEIRHRRRPHGNGPGLSRPFRNGPAGAQTPCLPWFFPERCRGTDPNEDPCGDGRYQPDQPVRL